MQPNDTIPTQEPEQQPTPSLNTNTTSNTQIYKPAGTIVAIVLVAVIVGVVAHHEVKNGNSSTYSAATASLVSDKDYDAFTYEANVTVSPDGFTPNVLTVKPNTRVYWKSADGDNSIHHIVPTQNSNEEEFGAESNDFTSDNGYAYSFRQEGTYYYHDAHNPTANGEIIVAK